MKKEKGDMRERRASKIGTDQNWVFFSLGRNPFSLFSFFFSLLSFLCSVLFVFRMASSSSSQNSKKIVPPTKRPCVVMEFAATSTLLSSLKSGGVKDISIQFGKDGFISCNGEKFEFKLATSPEYQELYEEKDDGEWVQVGNFSRKITVRPGYLTSKQRENYVKTTEEAERRTKERKIASLSDSDQLNRLGPRGKKKRGSTAVAVPPKPIQRTGSLPHRPKSQSSVSSSKGPASAERPSSIDRPYQTWDPLSHSKTSSSFERRSTTFQPKPIPPDKHPLKPTPSASSISEWSIEEHCIHLLAVKPLSLQRVNASLSKLGLMSSRLSNVLKNIAKSQTPGFYHLNTNLYSSVYPDDYPYSLSDREIVKDQLVKMSIPIVRRSADQKKRSSTTTTTTKDPPPQREKGGDGGGVAETEALKSSIEKKCANLTQEYDRLGVEIEKDVREIATSLTQVPFFPSLISGRSNSSRSSFDRKSPQDILGLLDQIDPENVQIEREELEASQKEFHKKSVQLEKKRKQYDHLRSLVQEERRKLQKIDKK